MSRITDQEVDEVEKATDEYIAFLENWVKKYFHLRDVMDKRDTATPDQLRRLDAVCAKMDNALQSIPQE